MKDINIRIGRFEDLQAIYDLVVELAVYEKEPEAVTASLENYQNDFKAGVFQLLVAEMEGQIVGTCIYYIAYSTWKGKMLYLEDFVVNQQFRRLGIGKLLFEALKKEAKELNCVLMKWQVLDWNEPAIEFYMKEEAIIEKGWWNGKFVLE